MNTITVDFSKNDGKIKAMHAVNNGPLSFRGTEGTFGFFRDAKIPYARLHDASFWSGYGGEYSVDVHRVFPNFDADVNDPNSYLFGPTDQYIKDIYSVGTKVFYRLGASIEHGYKKGTYPPKDFKKWAEICEHIIMHYTEGWANGFHYDIEYWEIWNEPDIAPVGDTPSPTWQGTKEQFCEFFGIVAKYLKSKFPHLKIGGPASAQSLSNLNKQLLEHCQKNNVPIDFYSFHTYARTPDWLVECTDMIKGYLETYGYNDTEIILNEWNYVKGWQGDQFMKTVKTILGLKGSSFYMASLLLCQDSALDMLMYYDARPTSFNGLFKACTYEPLKTYFCLKAFSKLYDLGTFIRADIADKDIYAIGAKNEEEGVILLTYYRDLERAPKKTVTVSVENFNGAKKAKLYVIDKKNDLKLEREVDLTNSKVIELEMKLFTTYQIIIEK